MNRKQRIHIVVDVEENERLTQAVHDLTADYQLGGYTHDAILDAIQTGAIVEALQCHKAELRYEDI
jgi:hypothetical protein